MYHPIESAHKVAEEWDSYGGETRWSRAMRDFAAAGGLCRYWCGMPGSASAIPLTFALFAPDGTKLECKYRLKDIIAATAKIKQLER